MLQKYAFSLHNMVTCLFSTFSDHFKLVHPNTVGKRILLNAAPAVFKIKPFYLRYFLLLQREGFLLSVQPEEVNIADLVVTELPIMKYRIECKPPLTAEMQLIGFCLNAQFLPQLTQC